MTYGAIVRQLLTDLEDVDEVNKQLDQMYSFSSSYTLSVAHSILLLIKSLFLYSYGAGDTTLESDLSMSFLPNLAFPDALISRRLLK